MELVAVNIWVTNKCNLRCEYCYVDKTSVSMDDNTSDEIIRFLIRNDNKNVRNINFHGGEPLLNFKIIKKIIETLELNGRQYVYSLTTNGTIISEEIKELISNYKINISVSMDGRKETHDKYRRFTNGKGSFDLVIKNLKIFSEITNVRVRMTVTPDTAGELYANFIYLYKSKLGNIGFVPDITVNWEKNKINEYIENYLKIAKQLKVENTNYYESMLNNLKKFEFKCIVCHGGAEYIHINYDGIVYPCMLTVNNPIFAFGEVNKYNYKMVTNRFEEINKKEVEKCKGCGLYNNCKGTACKYINKQITGDYYTPSTSLCSIQQAHYYILKEEGKL